jgi:hypothetical protein
LGTTKPVDEGVEVDEGLGTDEGVVTEPESVEDEYEQEEEQLKEEEEAEEEAAEAGAGWFARSKGLEKRQWGDLLDGVTEGVGAGAKTGTEESGSFEEGDVYDEDPADEDEGMIGSGSSSGSKVGSGSSSASESGVVTYAAPITYSVKKTGYYCIGEFSGSSSHYPLLSQELALRSDLPTIPPNIK